MVQALDHRAASVVVNPENLNRPAQPRAATLAEHADPAWSPNPQFWVAADEVTWPWPLDWVVGFKEITAPTNRRTVIASVFPRAAFGNKTPILLPSAGETVDATDDYKYCAALVVANLNSLALDFVARQKVHGQTLNLYILEQLPLVAPYAYEEPLGTGTVRNLVLDHVLRLTYAAHDMQPFARDLGYEGMPFVWDEEERRHLQARLDALYFLLYGFSRTDAKYVLDTFPRLRREDENRFGKYQTRDLVLAYMNALTAGDAESTVTI